MPTWQQTLEARIAKAAEPRQPKTVDTPPATPPATPAEIEAFVEQRLREVLARFEADVQQAANTVNPANTAGGSVDSAAGPDAPPAG